MKDICKIKCPCCKADLIVQSDTLYRVRYLNRRIGRCRSCKELMLLKYQSDNKTLQVQQMELQP